MYGTTAAAAGAMLLGRAPRALRHSGDRVVLPSGHVIHGVGTSGAFTWQQTGPSTLGSAGSLSLSLTTKQNYSLLVATLVSEDGTPAGAFTTTTTGWHRASAAPTPSGSGRVEIWYYPGTPDIPGTGGTTGSFSVTFQTSSTATCRGVMTEFGTPQNLPTGSGMIAVLDAPGLNWGHNSGSGPTTLTMLPAAGNVGSALGIVAAGDFFTSKVSGSWTAPTGTGWTPIRTLGGTVTAPWGSWYDLSLGAGVQPSASTSPAFSLGGDNDWAVAFAAFRGVVFPAIYIDGGENINTVALDPTGQELVLGGDVEGMWRSADFGDHWQLSQDGIYKVNWRCTAAVAWSQTVAAEVYACVGKKASANDGGFMVSTDGGVTWTMRAPATTYTFLNFQANQATEVLPTGEGVDEDRSVGHLIAQATVGTTHYLYAATYNSGVAVSTDDGNTWSQAGPSNPTPYLRALALDPNSSKGLYAGAWAFPASAPTQGGLYHTADVTVPSPSWSSVTLPSGVPAHSTVSDVKVLGGNVYVTFTQVGVYLYKPGAGTWFALANTDSSHGLWTGLDVYVDPSNSNNHVVVAVCGSASSIGSGNTNYTNVVRITVTAATGGIVSTDDLTGTANIKSSTVPPDGQSWWHNADVSFKNWIGQKFFHNPHVLVNPQNPSQIFVTGASGHFRTDNANLPVNQIEWDIAVNGAPAIAALNFATDPNQPEHFVVCGTDYTFIDVLNDNTGFNATTTSLSPTGKLESHAASFDRRASVGGNNHVVYVATNQKFAQNSTGDVQWISDGGSFQSTGLGAAMVAAKLPDNAVTGVYAANPGSGPYVVAAVIGNGMWKSAIPNDLASWSWSQVDSTIGTAGTSVERIPIVANATGTILYCFDRVAGILYRAKNNAGGHWVPIWTLTDTVADERSGWLAVNPTLTSVDELWVATSQNIWKLPDASSGVVGGMITPQNMSGTSFPEGCGGLAFTATSGTLYAVSLNGPTQTSAQLLTPQSGGGWQSGDPGNSFGSYVSWPGPAAMTALGSGATTQTLLVGSNPNLGIYGTVTA